MMRQLSCLIAGMVMLGSVSGNAGEPAMAYTPEQILEKSIAYHDPNGAWGKERVLIGVHTIYSAEYSKKTDRKESNLSILMAPYHEEFSYSKDDGDNKIEIAVQQGRGSLSVNGNTEVSDEEKERLRLADPTLYRDYCEYLYGMPMKLRDPGTNFDPVVSSMRFQERKAWRVKVTYDAEVGEDIWYFYFDHDTFALIAYQFYHDESKNDGEYITFEGEIVDEASGLRLPKVRAWYYNDGDGHLATDDIVSITTKMD